MVAQHIKAELAPNAIIGSSRRIDLKKISHPTQSLRSNKKDLVNLKNSIQRYGLLHPIVVRRSDTNRGADFEVISGARRLEALRELGIVEIPCQVTDASNREAFEIALTENLQRRNLDPVEEALAFQHYLKVRKWGHTKDLAKKLGKSEEYVNHRLKLLDLPEKILSMIGEGLSASHAEELSWFNDSEVQQRLADKTVEMRLTVNELHELAMREKKHQRANRNIQVSARTDDDNSNPWLPVMNETTRMPSEKILKRNILSLKYALSYLDNSIQESEKIRGAEKLVKFMIHERFLLHQIVDHFVSAVTDWKDLEFSTT